MFPDNQIHVANMGPTWVLLASWTLLSGLSLVILFKFSSFELKYISEMLLPD